MSTLYLVPEGIDPAVSGSRIRASGIRAALASTGPVFTAALDEAARDDAWGAMCRRLPLRRANVVRRLRDRVVSLVHGDPALLERALAAGAANAFRALLDAYRPELVLLSRPFFGPFIDLARAAGAAVVIDADESLVRAMRSVAAGRVSTYERLRATLDGQAASRFEGREYRRVDQLWVSSPVEQAYFTALLPESSVRVIPNLAPEPRSDAPSGPVLGVAFVGTYQYAPNQEAAMELIRSIMPAIRAVGGPTELVLMGRDPTAAMQQAAKEVGGVRFEGLVDDPIQVLRRCGVTLVPIRSGAGSRVKVLEAMRAGVPVITTARGLEGLAALVGRDVLVAETPDEFAAAVVRLRDDETLRRSLTSAAMSFVRQHHSQAAVTAAVDDALAALPERRP